ncbi:surface protein Lk90-like protein [Vibrio ponticus]|nr:surface protein Lk90-like protein [Vibrio ponticus]
MKTNFKTVFALVFFPLMLLLGGCNSEDAFSESTESSAVLERIAIVTSPTTTRGASTLTLARGNELSFEALGHYSDGTSQVLTNLNASDWQTSDSSIGRFDEPGVFIGVKEGAATVSASKDGIVSNTVSINVTPAEITEIQITPAPVSVAKGLTHQLTVTAVNSLDESIELNEGVTWASADESIATVSESGTLSAVNLGKVKITARFGEFEAEGAVEVTRAIAQTITLSQAETLEVYKTLPQQVRATGYFSDGTVSDVTDSVEWLQSNNNQLLTIDKGLFTYAETGSTEVTASMDGALSEPLPVETYLFKIIIDEFGDYSFAKDDLFYDGRNRLEITFPGNVFGTPINIFQSVENAPHRAQISDHYIQETIIPTLKENGMDYSDWEYILENARTRPFANFQAIALTDTESFYTDTTTQFTTIGGIYHYSIENDLVLANIQHEVESYSHFGDVHLYTMGVYNGASLYPALYLEEPSDSNNKYTLVLKLADEPESSYRQLVGNSFYSPTKSVTIYNRYNLYDLENKLFVLDRIVPHVSAESDKVFDFAIVDEAGTIVTKCEPYRLEFSISKYDDPDDIRYMTVDVKSPIFTFDGETCKLR